MLADCADPCIRGRISKLLASAVAAANFIFMLSLLLRIGFGGQLIRTREVANAGQFEQRIHGIVTSTSRFFLAPSYGPSIIFAPELVALVVVERCDTLWLGSPGQPIPLDGASSKAAKILSCLSIPVSAVSMRLIAYVWRKRQPALKQERYGPTSLERG
jgi:hypothetical protein